ncbi:MAG: HAD family phosphatase [Erysipelotrichaceae bacterium]|nr:HAD family phosphatase [Erysipelotrichaceae bacterium]
MIKAVIFDLDGIIIDTEVISYQLFKNFAEQYGHEFTLDNYIQNYSGRTAVANVTRIIKEFDLPTTNDEVMNYLIIHENNAIAHGVDLKEGVKELLEYLKDNNFKIILATSSMKERALNALKQHDIDKYFDDMVFGPEVKNAKPHPDIFLKAIEKASVEVNEGLVLEDSESGIQAAYSGNIPVICIPDMKEPSQRFKDMTVAVLPSLLNVIDYLENQR